MENRLYTVKLGFRGSIFSQLDSRLVGVSSLTMIEFGSSEFAMVEPDPIKAMPQKT